MRNTILTLAIAAIALVEAIYIFMNRSKLEDRTLHIKANDIATNEFDRILLEIEGENRIFKDSARTDIDTMKISIPIDFKPTSFTPTYAYIMVKKTAVERILLVHGDILDITAESKSTGSRIIKLKNGSKISTRSTTSTHNESEIFTPK